MTLQVQPIQQYMNELENTQKMCAQLIKTPHYAKLGLDGVFAVVSKARSLNIDPIYALNGGLYYLQGKVGMPAESMAALIREKGHSIVKDTKSNESVCILHGRRADNGDTWTCSFSVEDARRAGLLKNSYEKYPSAMLYNRAMSFLARQLFPDVIKGASYTPDELKEISTNPSFSSQEIEKSEPIDVELISSEQAEELRDIFAECDPTYISQVMVHLRKSSSEIESLEDVPLKLFERIKNAAIKKAQEYLKIQEVQNEELELEVVG